MKKKIWISGIILIIFVAGFLIGKRIYWNYKVAHAEKHVELASSTVLVFQSGVKLNHLIKEINGTLTTNPKIDTSKVLLLSKINIMNVKTKAKQSYTIVPESEANLKESKISVTSPFAQSFLGKKKGDVVEVKVPAGTMNFEILSIER